MKRKFDFELTHNFLEQNFNLCPKNIAIETPNITLTYEKLFWRVKRLSQALLENKLKKNDRIALFCKNDIAFCELMFACSMLNLVLVPINFRLAHKEIEYIVRNSKAKMIFFGHEFEEQINKIKFKSVLPKKIIKITANCDYDRFLRDQTYSSECNINSEATLFQMYTSGTTGNPKGVLINHRNIISLIKHGKDKLGPFTESSVSLVCMPLFHIAGSAWLFFGLAVGCKNILVVDINPEEIIRKITYKSITCTLLVPSVIHMICNAAEKTKVIINDLKTLVFGASPMPVNLLSRAKLIFPNTNFIHVYGLTETTGMFMSLNLSQIDNPKMLESCGKCFINSKVKIIDKKGNELPKNKIGEIICKSPQIMSGYYNNIKETNKVIINDWFYTGDAGYLDNNEYLFIKDRIKDVIISGGENIYPVEVENVLLSCPSVSEVAVIAAPDHKWGEVVVAVVIPTEVFNTDFETNLVDFCKDKLANFKIPKKFIIKDSLPKNASGKVLKNELRNMFK
jgi:acyl-CoA synthetase (AMP-forming)/AMP-acid ligase II